MLRKSALLALLVTLAGCSFGRHLAASTTTTTSGPTGSIAPATSNPGPTSTEPPAGTKVLYAAPVDMLGQPVGGLPVAAQASASCESGSDSVGNVEVYRCFAGNGVLDPCWVDAADGVLCMQSPWATSVEHLTAAGIPPGVDTVGTRLDDPWGVQLTTGARCVALQGAHDSFGTRVVDYSCSGGPVAGLALLRGIDRSTPYWTYQSVVYNGSNKVAGPTVSVASAWYAGPAPVTAAPCQGPSISVTSDSTTPSAGMTWLVFQNNSSSTCSLQGYPGVAVLDSSGNQTAQIKRTSINGASPPPVLIPPGGAASAVLEGDPDYPTASCPPYHQLLVTPPNTTTSNKVPVGDLVICPNAQVNPVGPGGRPISA